MPSRGITARLRTVVDSVIEMTLGRPSGAERVPQPGRSPLRWRTLAPSARGQPPADLDLVGIGLLVVQAAHPRNAPSPALDGQQPHPSLRVELLGPCRDLVGVLARQRLAPRCCTTSGRRSGPRSAAGRRDGRCAAAAAASSGRRCRPTRHWRPLCAGALAGLGQSTTHERRRHHELTVAVLDGIARGRPCVLPVVGEQLARHRGQRQRPEATRRPTAGRRGRRSCRRWTGCRRGCRRPRRSGLLRPVDVRGGVDLPEAAADGRAGCPQRAAHLVAVRVPVHPEDDVGVSQQQVAHLSPRPGAARTLSMVPMVWWLKMADVAVRGGRGRSTTARRG